MGILKGLLGVVGGAAKQLANQQVYELGFEDGRIGSPRRVTSMLSQWGQEKLEFYNRGYEDGQRQQMMDKLD